MKKLLLVVEESARIALKITHLLPLLHQGP
jgi:hypothetical protein